MIKRIIEHFFTRPVDQMFKIDPDGRIAYYPFGTLGYGRILPDAASAADLRRRMVQHTASCMIGLPLAALLLIGSANFWLGALTGQSLTAFLTGITLPGVFRGPLAPFIIVALSLVLLVPMLVVFAWPGRRTLSLPRTPKRLSWRQAHQTQPEWLQLVESMPRAGVV